MVNVSPCSERVLYGEAAEVTLQSINVRFKQLQIKQLFEPYSFYRLPQSLQLVFDEVQSFLLPANHDLVFIHRQFVVRILEVRIDFQQLCIALSCTDVIVSTDSFTLRTISVCACLRVCLCVCLYAYACVCVFVWGGCVRTTDEAFQGSFELHETHREGLWRRR